MNQREKNAKRNSIARKYHTPGCNVASKRPRNAIYWNISNKPEHERTKGDICWELLKAGHKFITEAVRNKDDIRVDIVDLDSGYEIEVVCTHDDPEILQRYKDEDVVAVFTEKDINPQILDVFSGD